MNGLCVDECERMCMCKEECKYFIIKNQHAAKHKPRQEKTRWKQHTARLLKLKIKKKRQRNVSLCYKFCVGTKKKEKREDIESNGLAQT